MTHPRHWKLSVGDVIQERDSRPRIVRKVHEHNGQLWGISLAIRHCSWTHRGYTVITANDLKQRSFRKLPMRRKRLAGRADRLLARAMKQRGGQPYLMTCCDVERAGLD